ncbi:phytanoyl-CoA dioxygenase family protein [Hyphobacterium sp.]|uniref:phytanoyl-CoA dioxygenase family protein n=1 Tax=Hyphobacterium sp. TaxID=2004662 RepID=UPI003BACCA3E
MPGSGPFANFERDGFARVRDPRIADAKTRLRDALIEHAQFIAQRILPAGVFDDVPRDKGFDAFLDAVYAVETDQAVTRAFYEVFPSLTPVIALIDLPVVRDLLAEAGLEKPVAGTLPLIRLDRPGDRRFATPAHQDSWYSLMSPNAVTNWTPLCEMTDDMGPLRVVPGSHAGGVKPFKPYDSGHEWFEASDVIPDERLVPIQVGHDEVLIFNQSLIHKSGLNASDRVRISVQLRYNDLATADALTSTYTASLSRYVLEQQKARLDARNV